MKTFVRAAFAASLLVGVAACDKDKPQTTAPEAPKAAIKVATPDGAIQQSVQMLKANNVDGMLQNVLPPAEYARIKAEWGKDYKDKPITDEDRQKFAENMAKLTASDAEEKLYAEIEPQLAQINAQYDQVMPMYVGMGTGWLQNAIQQNKDMSEADKQQATAAVNALAGWVQKTKFTDPALVKKVLGVVVATAREINLKTLDEARALTYDQAMQKVGVAIGGLKRALDVYGFSLDKTLDSLKTDVVSNDGKTAKVKVNYTLFDTPLAAESEMVNLDGRWYGKDSLKKLEEARAEKAATEAGTAAPEAAKD